MSYYDKQIEISELVGETITRIRIEGEAVFLTLNNEREVYIAHEQDCCETVRMLDHDDSFLSLTGEVITATSHDSESPADSKSYPQVIKDFWKGYGSGEDYQPESSTHTIITLSAGDKVVKLEWFGESNGYYGEGVELREKESES